MSVKKILGSIRKADQDFNLINEGDRIAVGVSGGKDSVLLLYALSLYQKVAKKVYNKNFEVIGIHIDLGFGNMNFNEVDQFFLNNKTTLIHEPSKIYDILKLHLKDNKIQCSLCSKFKKGAVNNVAKRLNCNKVAFAHHADDAIETLLMNAIYGGRLATFSPMMHLSDSNITFIRPFSYVFESDIKKAVKEINLPIVTSTCPRDGFTQRQEAKEMLHYIYHKYPSAKKNFLLMLTNEKQLDLWHIVNDENFHK